MRFKVEYNPDFFDDLAQAIDWSNEKQTGLGDTFYKNASKQTAKLSTTAMQFVVRYDDIRCRNIEKIPYMLHYHENPKTVKVEALFHTSRNPKIWSERTGYET